VRPRLRLPGGLRLGVAAKRSRSREDVAAAILTDKGVHHSAEVLTPVTVYRTHPVEDLVNAMITAVFVGLATAVHGGGTQLQPSLPTVLGVNVIAFLFFLVAFQLRHSHIWLSYGPWLSRVLISPAQHQIHHSSEVRHWDKNFGFIFAFWDALFRTLYVPRHHETFPLGVPNMNPAEFSSVASLYFLPFSKAWRRLLLGLSAAVAKSSPRT
jgi:sterol desaturase/sphingolipid hydroxylase (fatty acid hydroxylase superfamily)